MIELAQKSYEKDNIEFNVTNGIRHNYDSKSFNVVVSFQVLEHVYDYSIYLSEISRLLDDGGYCFFTTPNAMMRLKQGMTPWNKYHVKEFNSLELDELLSQYYSKVEIVGLFGDSKTYPIEFNRISNNREYALRQNSLYYRFKGKIGNLLKKLYQNKSNINKIKIELSQNVMDEFSTENFYFSKDNLDNCFDFFAFCKK
jgi:ubiquinone/menaquinone biosynthesis C-methylase UbiE